MKKGKALSSGNIFWYLPRNKIHVNRNLFRKFYAEKFVYSCSGLFFTSDTIDVDITQRNISITSLTEFITPVNSSSNLFYKKVAF